MDSPKIISPPPSPGSPIKGPPPKVQTDTPERSPFSSPPFEFVVEDQTFYVHPDVLRRHDSTLRRYVDADFAEKANNCAELKDVTAATFERFLEWLYAGWYNVPEPIVDVAEPEVNGTEKDKSLPAAETVDVDVDPYEGYGIAAQQFETTRPVGGSKARRRKMGVFSTELESSNPTAREVLRNSFNERPYSKFRTAVPVPPIRENTNEQEDYTGIFLCHAQLYVFAKSNCLSELEKLALEALHATLKSFELHAKRTPDILALFDYIYENTAPSGEGKPEEMRQMLTEYLAFEMDVLIDDKDFLRLMHEHDGDLLQDFVRVVRQRIRTSISAGLNG